MQIISEVINVMKKIKMGNMIVTGVSFKLCVQATQEAEIRKSKVQSVQNTHTHTHTHTKASNAAQVVEHLPSKREALSSNSSITKEKTKQNLWSRKPSEKIRFELSSEYNVATSIKPIMA
jgi:ADP-ribosylglycohydrolase